MAQDQAVMFGGTTSEPAGSPEALRRMLDAAQHFFDCRDRARAFAVWADVPPARSMAEAIERDFAGFDLEQAEASFRAALAALCNGPAGR